MTPRENFERMFNHQPMETIPNIWRDACVIRDSCVERPMNYTGTDAWGCNWISCEDSMNITHPDIHDLKLAEVCEWREKVHIPDMDQVDFTECDELYKKYTEEDKRDKMVMLISLNGIFERSHILMGFENAMCEFLMEPEEFGQMLEAFAAHKIRSLGMFAERYHPDIILYHDDLGTQTSTFLPETYYVEYLFPLYKKIVDSLKEKGVKYIVHHCCGKIESILDDWKVCGFDGLDSLMPCNDLKKIKETMGQDYVLWPGGDNQDILGVEGIEKNKIEEMVVRYYEIFGSDGTGFAMDTTSAYSLNKENDDYCTKMERKHGRAFLEAVKQGKPYSFVYETAV